MNIDSFIVGKITKTYSYKGEVVVICQYEELGDIIDEEEQVMFIYINNKPVPFFMDNFLQTDINTLRIKFADIDNEVKANNFIGLTVGLDSKYKQLLKKNKPSESLYEEIIGFKVFDLNRGYLGILKNIVEYPQQLIMEIDKNNKIILLPYNEEFIKNINYNNKVINVKSPDGLIDIYL
ncbi:MAG: 16S rRNA processing protein RimM [Bacteroidetes bacterium GWE2_29_8]|nr:MAG: 16S rRNA processing protein RimM [Bacteroidetes bacterium GWE2_29_8]OFY20790.1 MAG: 16S rRNA processing protein RimM [Bacteroidetes bacterium GWF2_29_10]